jgi:Glyoxalase/Bleomycin resistance protein/Dioxygenase superfamily
MKIKGIGFIGIPVSDIERARGFYEGDQGTGVALEMENFEEAIAQLKKSRIKFASEPFETPCCHMAVVQDPDGNKLMIHKLKPENAKGVCS